MASGAIAAAMVVSLSACASDNSSTEHPGSDTKAADATLTKANFSQTVAAAQKEVESAHMVATIEAAGSSGAISGDFTGFSDIASMSMDMQLKLAGKQIQMRLVDKTLYLSGAGISSDKSKPWVKIDLNDPNNPLASLMDTANPQSFTSYLQAVETLDDKGTETVDGVQAHHYVLTVDTAKALAANPALKGQDMSKLGLPAEITTDVWLNDDDLPVKMSVPLGKVASFEAHFSKYGEPVSVEAPPADQVGDFSFGG
ncbi:MAG: LppX_LprAFG lipoprotein [Propionibacteriales bacterium]|nr:LppX_LprAFG lipoprotein [Propionibacteriales bacterium]